MDNVYGLDSINAEGRDDDVYLHHRFRTHYPREEFTFQWFVTNFSSEYKEVHYDFSTTSNGTSWRITLLGAQKISLERRSGGPAVDVLINYQIAAIKEADEIKGSIRNHFDRVFDSVTLVSLLKDQLIKLQHGVFEFKCTMLIKGHFITEKIDLKSVAIEKIPNDLKKILASKAHYDTTICINEEKIEVHRAILCARSPYFDRMFQRMLQDKHTTVEINQIQHETIKLNHIDVDTFKSFISFLYNGEVDLSFDNAIKLYLVAVEYEVEDLRTACSAFLAFHLTVENVCSVLELAHINRDKTLKISAQKFIQMFLPGIKDSKALNEMKRKPNLRLQYTLVMESFYK